MEYERPSWSALPFSDKYALEVLKQGSIIDEIPLKDKEFYLIGRQLDRVDIPAEHPSVSRVHAALNFHNDGSLMICDLGSAQGTFVNKKMLDKHSYVKLNVGDLVKFGQSTRLYIVKGPDEEMPAEYNSANLERLRQEATAREERAQRAKEKAEQRAGASWGMSLDDEEDEEEEEKHDPRDASPGDKQDRGKRVVPHYLRGDEHYDRKYGEKFSADIRPEEIQSKKDEETLEKIRKKERKVQNMQEENRRIFLKEQNQDDGLTEGQLAAVARNDKAIEQLSQEISALVSQIRNKNAERSAVEDKKAVSGTNHKRSREEESELLDTTTSTADATTNWRLKKKMNRFGGGDAVTDHALSYEELRAALDNSEKKLAGTKQELQQVTQQVQTEQLKALKATGTEAGDDDIERIISQDLIHEAQQRLKSLHADELQQANAVRQYQRLLAAATPALKSLTAEKPKTPAIIALPTTSLATVPATLSPRSPSAVSPHKAPAVCAAAGAANTSPAAPITKAQPTQHAADEEVDYKQSRMVALEDFKKFVEEEKRRAQEIGRVASSEKTVVDTSPVDSSKRLELDRFEKKLRGLTTDEEAAVEDNPKPLNKRRHAVGPARPAELGKHVHNENAHHSVVDGVLEGGEIVWVPPKQQTGDGRTSLNDKFGY